MISDYLSRYFKADTVLPWLAVIACAAVILGGGYLLGMKWDAWSLIVGMCMAPVLLMVFMLTSLSS